MSPQRVVSYGCCVAAGVIAASHGGIICMVAVTIGQLGMGLGLVCDLYEKFGGVPPTEGHPK